YVRWVRTIGITDFGRTEKVGLVPLEAPADVPPTGATVQVGGADGGGAMLDFPPGAYASTASISCAWMTGPSSRGAPGTKLVVDATGKVSSVLGVLDVEASAQPSQAVAVTLPVPASAAGS